ncbi:hypothetical protein [Ensifer sp. 22564]|uniref:hypothetical protein n=1 Tax=Ensifer sp. 22564 TaxID=3453943 RepID=UPI003F841494
MCDKRFCVSVLSALALGMFMLVMRFSPELANWPELPLCEKNNCNVQGWLSATSGWAGFIAAGIAVALTWRQLSQQQKQTDFMLGDAPPTMDVTPDLDDPTEMVVRIVNWNRRAIFIKSVRLNVGNAMGVMEFKLDGNELSLAQVKWPFPLRGWEDRNNTGPHALQMKISASDGKELIRAWPENARVAVDIQMLDTKHRMQRLTASVHP